jgi:hypothetical protein
MGKAEGLGPDFLDYGQQDVEVTAPLPMSMTTFVGRDQDLGKIRSLFQEGKRLVTLVGIGGIGKTRMALQLGFSAGDLGWGSVYFVELASLADPGLVDGAVLESVGGGSSRSPLQAVAEHLREANALVVLDCCEHVLAAARHCAEVLLRGCPSVAVLATSRSPLDIDGELVWQVPVVLAGRFRPYPVRGVVGAGNGRGHWRYPFAGARVQPTRGAGHPG